MPSHRVVAQHRSFCHLADARVHCGATGATFAKYAAREGPPPPCCPVKALAKGCADAATSTGGDRKRHVRFQNCGVKHIRFHICGDAQIPGFIESVPGLFESPGLVSDCCWRE